MVTSVPPAGRAPELDERERAVWEALADVPDPEIPAVSVVDLGIIRSVEFSGEAGQRLRVEMMPTFVGCPAIDLMQRAIAERLAPFSGEVEVAVTFEQPWTSERITPEGRRRLRESGFAPPAAPPSVSRGALLEVLPRPPQESFGASLPVAECPYCGSRQTTLDNAFGPTLCRALYYCASCRQPFEQFKTV